MTSFFFFIIFGLIFFKIFQVEFFILYCDWLHKHAIILFYLFSIFRLFAHLVLRISSHSLSGVEHDAHILKNSI